MKTFEPVSYLPKRRVHSAGYRMVTSIGNAIKEKAKS